MQARPADAWRSLSQPEDLLLPCDVNDIVQVCRVPEIRRLTHKGIEKLGLVWNSEELIRLREEVGPEVDVRVFINRMNLGQIGVEHPLTREIIEVRALAYDYANNLTIYQHEVTRAHARRLNPEREASIRDWIDAQKRILAVIEKARSMKGYCLPGFASRFLLGNGERVPTPGLQALERPASNEPDVSSRNAEEQGSSPQATKQLKVKKPTRLVKVEFETTRRPR